MGNVLGDRNGQLNPRGVRKREGHSNRGVHGAPDEHRTFRPFSQRGAPPAHCGGFKKRELFSQRECRTEWVKKPGPISHFTRPDRMKRNQQMAHTIGLQFAALHKAKSPSTVRFNGPLQVLEHLLPFQLYHKLFLFYIISYI